MKRTAAYYLPALPVLRVIEWSIANVLLLTSYFLLTSCVRNPVTGKREFHMISEKAEISLGQETKNQLIKEYGLYINPILQSYINEVAQKLVQVSERQKIQYEFVILDTTLVNAFAVPGVVFLTRGILDLIDDESELSAVIGHEIGHITGFHAVKLIQKSMGYQFLSTFATVAAVLYGPRADDPRAYAVINQATNLVAAGFLNGYGRDFELEADRSGMRYAILAGYDPDAVISFFKRLKSLGEEKAHGIGIFLRTHPPTDARIKQIKRELTFLSGESDGGRRKGGQIKSHRKLAEMLRSTSTFQADHFERYQEIVKTMPKAPDPSGKINGNNYENTALILRMEVPHRWKLEMAYGKSLVRFYSPDGKAQGELQVQKIQPDPLVFSQKLNGDSISSEQSAAFAGVIVSTKILSARQWAENIEGDLKLQKRTGRDVSYPAGPTYVGTYQGMDRTGRPAHFKIYYILRGKERENQDGFMLSCAAPQDTYLDYLLDFEKIMKSLTLIP